MGDLTDEEILRRALQIMYRKQNSNDRDVTKRSPPLPPFESTTNLEYVTTLSENAYIYPVTENASFCNCDDCRASVHNFSFCSCCCEPNANGQQSSKQTVVRGYPVIDYVPTVIDLTLSDDEDGNESEKNPVENAVSSDATSALKPESSLQPVGTGKKGSVSSLKNRRISTRTVSVKNGSSRVVSTVVQDTAKRKGTVDSDGWSSDGSGEFDLHLEFERVKNEKKRKERQRRSMKSDDKKTCKRRKIQIEQNNSAANLTAYDENTQSHSKSFLPKLCRKRSKAKQVVMNTGKDNVKDIENEGRLSLSKSRVPSSAELNGLTELEKLATFTVSQLFPPTINDSKNDTLPTQTLYPTGSKNKHTGGVLNDILNKVHLRSKVKL